MRWSKDGKPLLVVANFTPVPREAYRVGVPFAEQWKEVLNSDSSIYVGSNYGNSGGAVAEETPSHGQAVLVLSPEG